MQTATTRSTTSRAVPALRVIVFCAAAASVGCGSGPKQQATTNGHPRGSVVRIANCADAVEFRGEVYLGTKVAGSAPLGRLLGPGTILGCGSGDDGDPVDVREIAGVDASVAVAVERPPRDIVYVVGSPCPGIDAGRYIDCLRTR